MKINVVDFGIYLRREKTYRKMLEVALHAEKLGFTGGFLNDHVIGFANEGKEDYLEAWTAMTGIGVNTTQLRIGQIVLFNSLRNPAFLAKSIATLDNMTNGRYELLIGSGWNEQEYTGYDLMEGGRGMPSARERVDRLEEAVRILKLMLNNEDTDFEGKYWKLKGAINLPQPIQKPMRLSIGCKGPRMMNITAKYADGWNIPGRTLPVIKEQMQQFSVIAGKYDKTLDDYYISGFSGIQLARNEDELRDMLKDTVNNSEDSYEKIVKESLVGTPEMLVDKFRILQDLGMKMMITAVVTHKDNNNNPVSFFNDSVKNMI